MNHNLPITPSLFAAVKSGATEIIAERRYADYVPSDYVTLYEWDDEANRYSNAVPLQVRLLTVLGHSNDPDRIPVDHFALTFERVGDAENAPTPPVPYLAVPKARMH